MYYYLGIQRDSAKHGHKKHEIQYIGFIETKQQSEDEGSVSKGFQRSWHCHLLFHLGCGTYMVAFMLFFTPYTYV